tara:strand:- start:607 stop:1413 length:807 start_codon:yes stop_codon:yes gene_type:complete
MARPKVVVSLCGNTVEEMLEDAALATAAGADMVEVRFDQLWIQREAVIEEDENEEGDRKRRNREPKWNYIPLPIESVDVEASINAFKSGIRIPVIFTCRPVRQDGGFPGEEPERISVLKFAIESGVSYIDIEDDVSDGDLNGLKGAITGSTKVIISDHSSTPPSVEEIIQRVDQMAAKGDLVKICYRLSNRGGALRVLEAAKDIGDREDGPDVALMGLGEGGDWARIHAPLIGTRIVYSTMDESMSVMKQGRINLEDLTIAWDLLEYD